MKILQTRPIKHENILGIIYYYKEHDNEGLFHHYQNSTSVQASMFTEVLNKLDRRSVKIIQWVKNSTCDDTVPSKIQPKKRLNGTPDNG